MQFKANLKWYLAGLIALPSAVIITLFFFKPDYLHLSQPASAAPTDDDAMFDSRIWPFTADVDGYPLPKFNMQKYHNYPPHNYRGPGGKAFALFYTSRHATDSNPYFIATQQIVYRLLHDPKKESQYPVIVFVTEVVSEEHRQYFATAGAIVREVKLNGFEPVIVGVPSRLRDMFSKLQMWRQTDFSRIAYLDADAFPMQNIDGIFDLVPEQQCKAGELPAADQKYVASLCKFVFGGYIELGDQVNAGVMVLKPDEAMHERLLRQSQNKTGWDTGFMEQALLNHAFGSKTPFPYSSFGHEWNSGKDMKEVLDIRILHHKSWADYWDPNRWAIEEYQETWANMLAFYESPEFEEKRLEDLRASLESLGRYKGNS